MNKKGLSGRIPLIALLAVFILSGALCMFFNPVIDINGVSLGYEMQTSLIEDVVYYSDRADDYGSYQEPVLLPEGTMIKVKAYITPEIVSMEKDNPGYYSFRYSSAYLDGKVLTVAVSTDWGSCLERTYAPFDTAFVDTIHVSKLYDPDYVISEYEKVKEECMEKESNTRKASAWISLAVTIPVTVIALLIRRVRVQKGRSAAYLFWTFLGVDCILLIYGVARLLIQVAAR